MTSASLIDAKARSCLAALHHQQPGAADVFADMNARHDLPRFATCRFGIAESPSPHYSGGVRWPKERSVITLGNFVKLASCALMCLIAAPAHASLSWEPMGPVPTSAGMTAVVSDPEDSRILWIASNASVWVSDDSGESFNLVLQLSRSAASTRLVGAGVSVDIDGTVDTGEPLAPDPTEDDDGNEVDPDALDEEGVIDDESTSIDPLTGEPILDGIADDTNAIDTGAADLEETANASETTTSEFGRFGVTRLRVIGDVVYVCTGRGVWYVPRTVRRMGHAREVRLGRRIAVNDVARGPLNRLYLATANGLWSVDTGGVGRQIAGIRDNTEIYALLQVGPNLIVSAGDGVRLMTADGIFQRLGLGLGRKIVTDLVLVDNERFALAAGGLIAVAVAANDGLALVENSWKVPGTTHVAPGRDGTLWAVGVTGAWRFDPETGWVRRSGGLIDRRVSSVAMSASGNAQLYLTGRAGAARLVPEAVRVWNKQAKRQAELVVRGYPTSEETIKAAQDARGARLEDIEGWHTQRGLSWLAPRVVGAFRWDRRREEESLFIEALGRRILDDVRVIPEDDYFLVEARWDLAPALYMLAETQSGVRSFRGRALKAMESVRETVGPLYQTWLKRRLELAGTHYDSVREYVRDYIGVQAAEADLYVYTHGAFPVTGAIEPKPAANEPSETLSE